MSEWATTAEANGLLCELDLAWNLGYKKLKAEVDSEEVLRLVGDEDSFQLFPLAQHISDLVKRDWDVPLSRIPRDCNMVADCLAKHANNLDSHETKIIVVPFFELNPLLLKDSVWVPN